MIEDQRKRTPMPGQIHRCGGKSKVKRVRWTGDTAIRTFYCDQCKVFHQHEAFDLMANPSTTSPSRPRQ
jgi:hypothetical protein